MKRLAALLLALLFAAPLLAQPLALPAPSAARLVQQPGAQLPLDLPVRDDLGQPAQLADYFRDGQPVLLVLGYYRCPQLCGLLMHGLLEGLQASAAPRHGWRIVGLSVDPDDTPASAHSRRALDLAYADFLLGPTAAPESMHLDLLVAPPRQVQRLAQSAGFTYATGDSAGAQTLYDHPATVIVATPQGRISRYLMGVRFEPAELRAALAEARGGEVGGWSGRIAMLCAHFDPQVGRLSAAVMNALRAVGLLSALSLALWCWRRRAGAGKEPR